MKLKDTIGIFPNAFSEAECKSIIYKLEEGIKTGKAYEGMSGDGGVNVFKKSTDYNLLNEDDESLANLVMSRFNEYTDAYLNNYPHHNDYRHNMIVEDKTYYPLLQIQKYDKGSGHYNAWHVEKECVDTAIRQFVYILYLNNVEEGGETGFLFKEEGNDDYFKVKPNTGKLIIHPASWPYVHKGYMPESDDKYILTTWLQYN
tara:strand:+ start:466 stop:1071 length:606 start_codon:yes stop_codon:yes gene_type:complete